MGKAVELLLNEGMKAECNVHLGAKLHERIYGRLGYTNGYTPSMARPSSASLKATWDPQGSQALHATPRLARSGGLGCAP